MRNLIEFEFYYPEDKQDSPLKAIGRYAIEATTKGEKTQNIRKNIEEFLQWCSANNISVE